jgi:hypothetical protein
LDQRGYLKWCTPKLTSIEKEKEEEEKEESSFFFFKEMKDWVFTSNEGFGGAPPPLGLNFRLLFSPRQMVSREYCRAIESGTFH